MAELLPYLAWEDFPHAHSELFSDFVFFVCAFICTGVQQLPMTIVVAAVHDDMSMRFKVTDVMDQVSRCVVVWQHNHDNSRVRDACVFKNFGLCSVA